MQNWFKKAVTPILVCCFVTAGMATGTESSSDVDLKQLYGKTIKPSLSKTEEKFEAFKTTLEGVTLGVEQKNALEELEASFKSVYQKPTLTAKPSRGPKWKEAAENYLDNRYDFYETSSYTDEDGDASEECNYEDGVEKIGEYYTKWSSVKPIKSSSSRPKSVAYLVDLMVDTWGYDADTGKKKHCLHKRMTYAVSAKSTSENIIDLTNDLF